MTAPVPSKPSQTLRWGIAIIIIGAVAALCIQQHAISELRQKVEALSARQSEAVPVPAPPPAAADDGKLEQLQKDVAEIPRLREELRLVLERLRQGPVASQPLPNPPQPKPPEMAGAAGTNLAAFKKLGERLSAGDPNAFRELRDAATELYRNNDPKKEEERGISNLQLMRGVFDVLGEQAGQGNPQAMQALKDSLGAGGHLRAFAPDALGKAAAAGNTEALGILVNYPAWGILLSSAVSALAAPAEANMEPAVDVLVGVLQNPRSRALWQTASQGLVGAALKGNATARTALEAYGNAARNGP